MKKIIIFSGILLFMAIGTYAMAVTIGVEPPAQYVNNLRTCTPYFGKYVKNAMTSEYRVIKKLPDGRCLASITEYPDYSNPQDYKDAAYLVRAFGGDKMTDAEVAKIIYSSNSKSTTTCKFSPTQRQALYSAYLKHDGNPSSGSVKRDKNGNIVELNGSFDSSKMSSYDNLMSSYLSGTCSE